VRSTTVKGTSTVAEEPKLMTASRCTARLASPFRARRSRVIRSNTSWCVERWTMLPDRSMSSATSSPGDADAATLAKRNSAATLVLHLLLHIGDLRSDLAQGSLGPFQLGARGRDLVLRSCDLFLELTNVT